MQSYVAKVVLALLSDPGGHLSTHVIKKIVADDLGIQMYYPGDHWQDYSRAIKDEALDRNIVIIPVQGDWYVNPSTEKVFLWLQQEAGHCDARFVRINRVLGLSPYLGDLRIGKVGTEGTFADMFDKAGDACHEIADKLRAETGIDI